MLHTFAFKPTALYLAVALALAGCGGTGQDTGESQNHSQTIQGVAIDGYVARATVFLDYDNNGTRDPWEPFAFTDDSGYFSYNPLTNTDYCSASVDPQLSLYCLRTTRVLKETVLRVDGGYDVLTGEPFMGQLSRRLDLSSGSPVNALVSPLTTLLTDLRNPTDRTALMTLLGIKDADLEVDFLAGTIETSLLNATLKAHKIVSLFAGLLEDHYSEIGSQAGAANDMSAAIYRHLARQMVERQLSLDEILEDAQAVTDILEAAELDAQRIYDQWDMLLPPPVQTTDYNRVQEQGAQLAQTVNELIPGDLVANSPEDIQGRARLVEALTLKALKGGAERSSFDNAINFIRNTDNQDLLSALIEHLGHPTADLTRLLQHSFTGQDLASAEAIGNLIRLPQDAEPFQQIGGRQLRVSDMDLGFAPNHLNDSEVEIYFHAANNHSDRGTFDACVKYIKDASTDGKLGDANTRGKLVKGYWSLLDANRNGGASYSLLLNIEFLGAVYQAILKPAGMVTVQNATMQVIRFDHAGELRAWHSATGLQDTTSLPQTDADCVQRLPSRIGI